MDTIKSKIILSNILPEEIEANIQFLVFSKLSSILIWQLRNNTV